MNANHILIGQPTAKPLPPAKRLLRQVHRLTQRRRLVHRLLMLRVRVAVSHDPTAGLDMHVPLPTSHLSRLTSHVLLLSTLYCLLSTVPLFADTTNRWEFDDQNDYHWWCRSNSDCKRVAFTVS